MGLAVGRWTNASVRQFAGSEDPVHAILARARSVVLDAMDRGWRGPPFNPLDLADLLGIDVRAAEGVRDARILLLDSGRFRVEFNPFRSDARIRYNVAHEIVHTFFEDCGDVIRHRASRTEIEGDDWQLEALCNVGAAEILMPAGLFPEDEDVDVSSLLGLRKKFSVSTETVAIRLAELSSQPLAAFAASKVEEGRNKDRYRLDYVVPSASWTIPRAKGVLLPRETLLRECSAIGYTNHGVESWEQLGEALTVHVVAVPPYPGRITPRAVGLARPTSQVEQRTPLFKIVQGDALDPHGEAPRIVAHVVNDKTPRWGGGFALAVRKRFPAVQDAFIMHVEAELRSLRLGNTIVTAIEPGLAVANMVAQKGYRQTGRRLVRYAALRACLELLSVEATRSGASVHMPRIGAGQGGGDWSIIEDLIRMTLVGRGVSVTVYDLPGTEYKSGQTSLEL